MNPFVMVYEALWNMATASSELSSVVKVGNRIRFDHTSTFDPIKRQVSQADLPEILLVGTTSGGNIGETSSTSRITKSYDWIIATGDLSVVNRLLPIEWALWCAMCDWHATLSALEWEGQRFVKVLRLTGATSGMTDSERNRGIRGWSTIWGVEVEMHFRTSDLRAQIAPTTTL